MLTTTLRVKSIALAIATALACSGAAAACSSSVSSPSAGPDASVAPRTDAAASDADASTEPDDAGADVGADAGGPDAKDILGTLSGACGTMGPALQAATASLVENQLVFVASETYGRDAGLSPGGQRLFDTPNAGGSSAESEVMSFEVLHFCEGATLLKTETEIAYTPPDDAGPSTISDILVDIRGEKYGVQVVRTYKPSPGMTDPEVKSTIEGKLRGIRRSTQRVLPQDRWRKQILHVFTIGQPGLAAVQRVWPTISDVDKGDSVVLVTATTGGGFLYCSSKPPLGSECP